MPTISEIPQEALPVRYNSGGFLPDVGLYRRGEVFCHGPSRSHFGLLGLTLLGAVVMVVLPGQTRAMVAGELKYWIAGIFVFAGLFDIVPHLILSKWR